MVLSFLFRYWFRYWHAANEVTSNYMGQLWSSLLTDVHHQAISYQTACLKCLILLIQSTMINEVASKWRQNVELSTWHAISMPPGIKFYISFLQIIGTRPDIAFYRTDSRFTPSQWETSLQSNAVSHWLGANLESALACCMWIFRPNRRNFSTGLTTWGGLFSMGDTSNYDWNHAILAAVICDLFTSMLATLPLM